MVLKLLFFQIDGLALVRQMKKFNENVITNSSKGECEVVVYSDDHFGTIAQMPIDRVELLIHAWIDRYKELQKLRILNMYYF